jgi:hypothetical protein
MRRVVQALLEEVDWNTYPAGKIKQGSVVDDQPEFPFIVHRLRITDPSSSGRGRMGLEVWVYDYPGSYQRIDDTLKAIRQKFVGVCDRRVGDEHVSQIEWTGDSPDLPAEEYRGITRSSSFNLIGSTA